MAETEKYDPFAPPKDHVTEMRAMRETQAHNPPQTEPPDAIEGAPESKSLEQIADEYHRANLPNPDYVPAASAYRHAGYPAPDGEPPPSWKEPSLTVDNPDVWKHRGQGLRCSTCMWWVVKSAPLGRCRKHAPTLGGYPATYDVDWCGDHKLR